MRTTKIKSLIFLLIVSISVACSLLSCIKEDKEPCKGIQCQNGGVCSDGSCSCPTGYSGDRCQIPTTTTTQITGCTDPKATNYNPAATIACASCCTYTATTTGNLKFWTNAPYNGNISVMLDPDTYPRSAVLTGYYSIQPACISDAAGGNFTLVEQGEHSFTAIAASGRQWSGKVNVLGNNCNRVYLAQ